MNLIEVWKIVHLLSSDSKLTSSGEGHFYSKNCFYCYSGIFSYNSKIGYVVYLSPQKRKGNSMSNLSVWIRFLGIDTLSTKQTQVTRVVGAAPMAYSLFTKELRINPAQSSWINHDRFILSAGHSFSNAMPFFTFLVFEDVSMDEVRTSVNGALKRRSPRIWAYCRGWCNNRTSRTRIATATGFAQAERFLAAKYNREGYNVFDHYTYIICGDGDLMEDCLKAKAASCKACKNLTSWLFFMIQMINLDGETKGRHRKCSWWSGARKKRTKTRCA